MKSVDETGGGAAGPGKIAGRAASVKSRGSEAAGPPFDGRRGGLQRRAVGLIAAGFVALSGLMALSVGSVSAVWHVEDAGGWNGVGSQTVRLIKVTVPPMGIVLGHIWGQVTTPYGDGDLAYGWTCDPDGTYAGLTQYTAITTTVWNISGGAMSMVVVEPFARQCSGFLRVIGGVQGFAVSSEFSLQWPDAASPDPSSTVNPSASPTYTQGPWTGPTAPPSCIPDWSGICTSGYEVEQVLSASCETSYVGGCYVDVGNVLAGHLVYVALSEWVALGVVPEYVVAAEAYAGPYNYEGSPQFSVVPSDYGLMCAEFLLYGPLTDSRMCGEYVTGGDGTHGYGPPGGVWPLWVAGGGYWGVTINSSMSGGNQYHVEMHGTAKVYEGASTYYGVQVWDYGVYAEDMQLPTVPMPIYPPAPVVSGPLPSANPSWPGPGTSAGGLGQPLPGGGGTGVPPGGSSDQCQTGPLSGECKVGIGGYAETENCGGDWWDVGADLAYVGCMIGNIGTAIGNGARYVVNAGLDAIIPGSGTGRVIDELSDKLEGMGNGSGGGSGGGGLSGQMLGGGGTFGLASGGGFEYVIHFAWNGVSHDVDVGSAVSEAMAQLSGFRGVMAAGVWFIGWLTMAQFVPKKFKKVG